jgi:hypothetical protein
MVPVALPTYAGAKGGRVAPEPRAIPDAAATSAEIAAMINVLRLTIDAAL